MTCRLHARSILLMSSSTDSHHDGHVVTDLSGPALQPGQAGRVRVRDPADPAAGGTAGRFPIKFYLTAMLFIVFDIEIVFLYPWAQSAVALGVLGLVEISCSSSRSPSSTRTHGAAADSDWD